MLEKLGPLDADRIADLRPYLESVPDPRSRRGRWYSLTAILLVCACAAVYGAKSIDEFGEFGEFGERATNSLLASLGVRRHLLGWRRSPKPVTPGRVLQALDGDALDQAVCAYLADRHRITASADVPGARSRQVIAVDGKALKGSAGLDTPRRHLPSDMTDAEWVVVRPLLPVPGWLRGRGGRPEAYCHRAMLDAIRYLVDNGIKWRAMPADFPPWDRVYAFFRRWRDHGLVREFHDRLRGQVRTRLGRDAEPTAAVIDSQCVKADAVVGSDSRGFDGGKLVNGRERHVVVDTLGLLLAVMVTAADVGDRTAAKVLLEQVADAHHRLALVWADAGYTGSLVEHCLAAFALVLAIVKRSDDMRGFVVLPKRWIVERLFAHLMRSRRLVRDFERRTTSAEAMIY
ncbi:IS5 family transposase [Streptomyces sp. NPDC020192]|uniref:IS5 family transposase n=1 Tax=Streptomyces sp. NPDC020192 TaxID=3365066 RepID=UPI00379208AF